MPWRRAIKLLLPVLDGLQKVHQAGFMHRDIKPGNLYLTRDDELILLDFGSARQVSGTHTRSLLIFSEGFAPYEQYLQGHLNRQGPWTDVYAVAATLYFMLTARRVPSALDRKQAELLQQSDLLKPARQVIPDLPLALDAALLRALAVEPEQRLQSITAFRQHLETVLAEEDEPRPPPRPPPPPPPEPPTQPQVAPKPPIPPKAAPAPPAKPRPAAPPPPKAAPERSGQPNWRVAAVVIAMIGLIAWGGWSIGLRGSSKPAAPLLEPDMARIPGGCFQMGSPASEADRDGAERQHRVCVDAFEIGKYEVTQGQWQAVMGDNPPYFKRGDDYPVESVSWNDIQAYLEKLNARTGRKYRLPTEAEWEYACRGGATGQRYCGGDDPDRLAWYDANSGRQTHPVGRKAANGYGLYDLSGNIWEWTCSLYDESYGGAETKCTDNGTGGLRSLRGGS
ncbi:MAG: SUMF1/EgtB/PvdO family nonheme iron enzyme [Candidatus Competibacteraceae bacterium]|nr:MAG: SUMF1/EgtB/PvdO family nonheme iron enzyme [Candidatus Competibacteraceae bacterium]